jgi:serine/threonine-protein kinase
VATSPTSSAGPPADLAGRVLAGRYRLERRIASGGMAEVWEATDQVLTRRVAVKLLHGHLARDESFVKRFRAEAIASARLAHPSIVSVYDTFADGGLEGIVMELVSGTTMRADLDQHGPMKLDAVLAIGTQVADALGAAHATGLVHRDVKPANILLSADGRVLVADFGIAKAAQGNDLTSDGAIVGTAKYLAPEQVEGAAIDGRTDLYALGVVLYEALTGTPPFVADTDTGTALARLHRDPTPPRQVRSAIPPAVEAVVMRAMARRPEDRYPDAASMRAALLAAGANPGHAPAAAAAAVAASDDQHRLAPPPPPPASGPPSPDPTGHPPDHDGRETSNRRGLKIGLAIVLVLAVAAAAIWAATSHSSSSKALAISAVATFDPFGDNKTERPELVAFAHDGNETSVWQTEHYKDPDLAAGKGGVGLVVQLDGSHTVSSVTVDSPDDGWAASIYLLDAPTPATLTGWGTAAGSVDGASSGPTAISTDGGGAPASRVLVWFTHLPANGVMQVAEVSVRGES